MLPSLTLFLLLARMLPSSVLSPLLLLPWGQLALMLTSGGIFNCGALHEC